MKKIGIGILLLLLYSIPFVYIGMYVDFTYVSVLGYGAMIIITSLLAYGSQRWVNWLPIVIGNILSTCISYYLLNLTHGNSHWDGYFKPFMPLQAVILFSLLNLIPQLMVWIMTYKRKHK